MCDVLILCCLSWTIKIAVLIGTHSPLSFHSSKILGQHGKHTRILISQFIAEADQDFKEGEGKFTLKHDNCSLSPAT